MGAVQKRRLGKAELRALLPGWIWLILFVACPAALLLVIALATTGDGVPPYTMGLDAANFAAVLTDPFYATAFVSSIRIAGISALLCLLLGFPLASAIARQPPARRPVLLLGLMLPFWTGFLLRIAALVGLMRDDGWINTATGLLGIPPIPMLHTDFAMYVGIVYAYLPFMVLPLQARLASLDPALAEAARDLGATTARVFAEITWPLALPGVLAGFALVFVPAMGEYVIPELLGGGASQTMGRVIWSEFFDNHDWPRAAALAVLLLVLLLAAIALAPIALARRR